MPRKSKTWFNIGFLVLTVALPIVCLIAEFAVERLHINWDWWLSGGTLPFFAVGAAICLLELVRAFLPTAYKWIWSVLASAAVPWGLYGLVWYLPNALKWDDHIFFLPAIALAIGVAKVRHWLSEQQISILAVVTAAILYVHLALSWRKTDELCRWLRGEEPFTAHGGGGGAGGGGGFAAMGYGLDETFWLIYGSPGILLLAAILAVWPNFAWTAKLIDASWKGLGQLRRQWIGLDLNEGQRSSKKPFV